jgi:hypothetical protein
MAALEPPLEAAADSCPGALECDPLATGDYRGDQRRTGASEVLLDTRLDRALGPADVVASDPAAGHRQPVLEVQQVFGRQAFYADLILDAGAGRRASGDWVGIKVPLGLEAASI